MILSLVTSVVIWLVIVYYVEPDKVQTIRNVPVTITADQVDALAALNLRIVDSEIETVDVRIEGARPIVGAVKPADVDIRADLTGITAPGSFDVVLSGGRTGNYSAGDKFGKGFTLAQTDAIGPSTVRVRVDRQAQKTFQITTDIEGLQTPEDYVRGQTKVSPREITISGPETDVGRIDKCVVSISFDAPITSSKTRTGQIVLYDAEGNELDSRLLTMSAETADVTIPVLKQKELPVSVEYLNVPSGFPIDWLEDEYSVASLLVAGPEELIDAYSQLDMGFININEITIDSNFFAFDVNSFLPSGFTNLSGTDTVIVTIKTADMLEGNYTIPGDNIRVTNVPVNYSVTVESPSISGVHIIGDADVMATLSGSDLVAEVDMSTKDVSSPGPYTMPVRISAPGKGLAWASGDYTVLVTIKER